MLCINYIIDKDKITYKDYYHNELNDKYLCDNKNLINIDL